jgi:hypothetical protein
MSVSHLRVSIGTGFIVFLTTLGLIDSIALAANRLYSKILSDPGKRVETVTDRTHHMVTCWPWQVKNGLA